MSDLPIVKRLREGQRYTNVLDGEMMKDAADTIEALAAALEKIIDNHEFCRRYRVDVKHYPEEGKHLHSADIARAALARVRGKA